MLKVSIYSVNQPGSYAPVCVCIGEKCTLNQDVGKSRLTTDTKTEKMKNHIVNFTKNSNTLKIFEAYFLYI